MSDEIRPVVEQQTRLDTARIGAARRVIDPIFLDAPLYRCEALESELGRVVSIRLETANPVRSLKARGTEVLTSLLAESGSRAVVCASAGNLGQAFAWSGRRRGLDVAVVASRHAPAAKLDRIRALSATSRLVDGDFDTARERDAPRPRDPLTLNRRARVRKPDDPDGGGLPAAVSDDKRERRARGGAGQPGVSRYILERRR